MIEKVLLRTAAESATEAAGASVAHSLHTIPVTIGISGHLGAGKTAFMRGFFRSLGVTESITSPTYALEQRYQTSRGDALHIDLYRLNKAEAIELLQYSNHHPGIRCVEWPERCGDMATDISVMIDEMPDGTRSIAIECNDVEWPDDATIAAWRKDVSLPANVASHCDVVADFCSKAARSLIERGTFIRLSFVRAAGKVHDLLRFIDFKPGAAPAGHVDPPETIAAWAEWKQRYPYATHEEAVGAFLREKKFDALGRLAASHSIHFPVTKRTTVEEHLLYYADKRVIGDRVVSIAERYDDFALRYGKGTRSPESLEWERDTRDTENLLFPDGPPL